MFNKILIANRGEIALRIIRACKELDIETVIVYSEADADTLAVRFADEALCIGASKSSESYLSMPRIVSAAEITNADAIHPGYGFLAENAEFAEVIESCGLTFIGPKPETIRVMGDKALARETMRGAGVPVIPGSEGSVESALDAQKIAKDIGFPLLLKAVSGGGGRGLRIVESIDQVESAFTSASREADLAFGDGRMYMERYLRSPRHIEFQIAGDAKRCIHIGERECSIQRRHQKLLEESPSPIMSPELRNAMGEAAIKGAESVDYLGLGTMEFLLDPKGEFFFIEMNTRVQVEHPVTECVSGIDLIKLQLRLAAGEDLYLDTDDIALTGHAIECRINAEDPDTGFTPCPGTVEVFHPPGGPGIRIDSHIYAGYRIPPHYDSLIAKLISYGESRDEARRRMLRALDEFIIEGVKTTIPYHQRLLQNESFKAGEFSTDFIRTMEQ